MQSAVSVYKYNINSGEQGLRWFLLQAFREGWNILALEQHDTPEDPRTLNVTEQLDNIKVRTLERKLPSYRLKISFFL